MRVLLFSLSDFADFLLVSLFRLHAFCNDHVAAHAECGMFPSVFFSRVEFEESSSLHETLDCPTYVIARQFSEFGCARLRMTPQKLNDEPWTLTQLPPWPV